MTVHSGFDAWTAITPAVQSASGRVVAAVGYVGANGHAHLPLKRGDLLICDASEPAVRSGATNPAGLRPFLAAGVEVWTHQGLHAKVIVLPRRAFVGSQNASDHSATQLLEAAIETTVSNDVRALRDFVEGLGDRQLSTTDLDELEQLRPRRQRPRPIARRRAALPDDVDRVVVLRFELDDWTSDEWKLYHEVRAAAAAGVRRRGTGSRPETIAVSKYSFGRIRVGDWVVHQDSERSYSPGIVVEMARRGDAYLVWLSRPPCTSTSITRSVPSVIPQPNVLQTLTGRRAREVIDQFR